MSKRLSKLNTLNVFMVIAILAITLSLTIIIYINQDFNTYDNGVRILVSDQRNDIERGIYKPGAYPYIVFGLNGKVLYSCKPFEQHIGDQVNVQEMLQLDKSFSYNNKDILKESFILQKNGVTSGFVVFLIPKSKVMTYTKSEQLVYIFLPIIIGVILCIILAIMRTIYFRKYFLRPLKEISVSAKGIIAGNYDLEVVRIYGKNATENEISDLTCSFELMRDELKEKQLKEEELKKSQQELISCISHDLRTPISTIKAYCEGLRDNIAKTPERQKEYVNIIINKTNLLAGMIEDLLEYSNAELNQLEIKRTEVYFNSFFSRLMAEVKTFVNQNGFAFEDKILTPQVLVNIDQKRITEVIYNLIENSMKYMDTSHGIIEITAELKNRSILVSVKDNGIGICPNEIPYVFDKFYRAQRTRNSNIPGSGLGLSICKYIINAHDGEIYCTSKKTEGCEIGFTLTI